jgi:hypothetical protein
MTTLDELFAARTALVVPEAIGSGPAAEIRARFERAGYARYALLDRGSYEELRNPHEPELFAALAGVATRVTGRTLQVAGARALRLSAGDYLLTHHDRVDEERAVELMLDLSVASVAGAEVHYRDRGRVVFRFASAPGALSVIDRGPTVQCNHTYVSKLRGSASVVRLVLVLRGSSEKSRTPFPVNSDHVRK